MEPLAVIMSDTDVLDHFLQEPGAPCPGGASPKLSLVRKSAGYSVFRGVYMKHNLVLATNEETFYARAKLAGNWKELLYASTAYSLVNGLLAGQLGVAGKRNAKLFFPTDVVFPR